MLKEFMDITYIHENSIKSLNNEKLTVNIKQDKCNVLVSNKDCNMNYLCNICNKEYISYGSLWNHNKLKHNNAQITQKKFTRRTNLEYHYNNSCKYIKIKENELNNTFMLQQKINEMSKKIELLENQNNIINNGTINNINNTIYINKSNSENQ